MGDGWARYRDTSRGIQVEAARATQGGAEKVEGTRLISLRLDRRTEADGEEERISV